MTDVPGDPIAVSAATRSASETESAGSQDAVPAAAGSGQKLGVSGLDSDASVPCLFPRERRSDRYRSRAHERAGLQGSRAEDVGLLRHPTLLLAPPGRSGLILSVGQKVVCTSPPKPTRSICWKSCRLSTVAKAGRSPPRSFLSPESSYSGAAGMPATMRVGIASDCRTAVPRLWVV